MVNNDQKPLGEQRFLALFCLYFYFGLDTMITVSRSLRRNLEAGTVSFTVRRHHEHSNYYKGMHLIGVVYSVRGLVH